MIENMAFSFRVDGNWCHDFPKLARESGFYFNTHRTHIRVDWNRISTIDIGRVISERDFFTIEDNINNVVDYHLESEYDVKILDPNFVKLFRLAQLSVEYLLYCKQYLDRSVVILKDELRSKLEENVRLKKELSIYENNMKELQEKFRDQYKFVEKRFSDSHGEIHKCPFCPKTFIADVFMNSHITRRHSNSSQLSVISPVHEQYKAETEKLHHEIKTLKERLNETERLVKNESVKLHDSTRLHRKTYSDMKNRESDRSDSTEENKLEEEHKKYQEDMNHFTTMLFSEIKSLKQDEKKSNDKNDSANENLRELFKQQEDEIHRLRDQLQRLSVQKSTLDIETIQSQLNSQENYWKSKIDQFESQHRNDIKTLYAQLKMTQASADFVKADYLNKIKQLEKSKNTQTHMKDAIHNQCNQDNSTEVIIEDVDKISDIDVPNITVSGNKSQRIIVSAIDSVEGIIGTHTESHNTFEYIPEKLHDDFETLSDQLNGVNNNLPSVIVERIKNKNSSNNGVDSKKNIEISKHSSKMDALLNDSDESSLESKITSESDRNDQLQDLNDQDLTEKEMSEELGDIHEQLEQKLRDLGVDPEWQQIPNVTYQQLINTVKYHRSIYMKKYATFGSLRHKIIEQLAEKVDIYQKKNSSSHTNKTVKESSSDNLITDVRSKAFKALHYPNIHTSKIKLQTLPSHRKSSINKFNIELLPEKMNQSELKKHKPPVSELQQSVDNNENELPSSSEERYTSNPSRLNTKPTESFDMKYLSHSYESIKDYNITDNNYRKTMSIPSKMSKPTMTSTPQRHFDIISSKDEIIAGQLSSQTPNSEGYVNSLKNNKSVLKSTTGSTGSLVKKKVLFDLQTEKNSDDETLQNQDIYVNELKQITDKESDSDFEVSNISEEKPYNDSQVKQPPNSKDFFSKSAQSERIIGLSKKLEFQLNSIRHKPSGGVAIFTKPFHTQNEKLPHQQHKSERNPLLMKLPQSTPQSLKACGQTSSDYNSNTKDSNLDMDIEELLRED